MLLCQKAVMQYHSRCDNYGIFLAVEIGLGTEDGHLLALIPESSLVITVADTGTHKTIDIISVSMITLVYCSTMQVSFVVAVSSVLLLVSFVQLI